MSFCVGELPAVPFGAQGAGDGLRVSFLSQEGRIDVHYNGSLMASEVVGSGVLRAGWTRRKRVADRECGVDCRLRCWGGSSDTFPLSCARESLVVVALRAW